MAVLQRKNIATPDETRTFDKGRVEMISMDGVTFGRSVFEPGWRWSECVKPIAQTDSCEFHHRTFIISGQLHVRLDDGTEIEAGAGDVLTVPPGHDAWVVGDEPCVALDFEESTKDYARPR